MIIPTFERINGLNAGFFDYRIEIVEDMQNQIVAMINLQAVDKEI